MIKRLFSKKQQRDIRFLPYEDYRVITKTKPALNRCNTRSWMKASDALKVNITSAGLNDYIEYDQAITVESRAKHLPFYAKRSFPEMADKLSASRSGLGNVKPGSLGVFSDTKMYSALIKSELNSYDINIKHFNHPKTFIPCQYPFFDSISAWIIFLSDEADDDFLDHFIDRYIDKPSLFLFAKTNRLKTTQKINDFVKEAGLASNKSLCGDLA